jgi:hypothetical protein
LPPFHLAPRSFLSVACNAVLRRAVPSLLQAFTQQLAGDYRRVRGSAHTPAPCRSRSVCSCSGRVSPTTETHAGRRRADNSQLHSVLVFSKISRSHQRRVEQRRRNKVPRLCAPGKYRSI